MSQVPGLQQIPPLRETHSTMGRGPPRVVVRGGLAPPEGRRRVAARGWGVGSGGRLRSAWPWPYELSPGRVQGLL